MYLVPERRWLGPQSIPCQSISCTNGRFQPNFNFFFKPFSFDTKTVTSRSHLELAQRECVAARNAFLSSTASLSLPPHLNPFLITFGCPSPLVFSSLAILLQLPSSCHHEQSGGHASYSSSFLREPSPLSFPNKYDSSTFQASRQERTRKIP